MAFDNLRSDLVRRQQQVGIVQAHPSIAPSAWSADSWAGPISTLRTSTDRQQVRLPLGGSTASVSWCTRYVRSSPNIRHFRTRSALRICATCGPADAGLGRRRTTAPWLSYAILLGWRTTYCVRFGPHTDQVA